jgi:hypothetical protein
MTAESVARVRTLRQIQFRRAEEEPSLRAERSNPWPQQRKEEWIASVAMTAVECRVGKGALAPCPPFFAEENGGHAALCPPYSSAAAVPSPDSIFKQPNRHCERSEAIHLAAQRKEDGLLRFARNDGSLIPNAASRSRGAMRPRRAFIFRPKRAWGMPGARCTRGLVCNCSGRTHTSNNEYTGIARHPRTQWFYGLCRALPGDRAFLPPSPREYGFALPGRANKTSARLDASVGASGPHDFAVRESISRQRAQRSLTSLIDPPCDPSRAQRCRAHRNPPRVSRRP